MHIGFVSVESPLEPGGGIAAYLRALIPALLRAGHRVTVVARSRKSSAYRYRHGALRVLHVRLPNLHWYASKLPSLSRVALPLREAEWSLALYRHAAQAFRHDPVDVIESGETGAALLAARPLAPLVIRLHGSDYIFAKNGAAPLHPGLLAVHRLQCAAMRRAALVSAPSRAAAHTMATELAWQPDRIAVAPNPLDAHLLAQARTAPPSDPSLPTVLYLGRLAPVKGVETLLAAADLLRRAIPYIRFLLAGPWQMAESPEQFSLCEVTSIPQTPGIHWLGAQPHDQIAVLYQQATLFVMPSLFESFGLGAAEALAFGLPVVASAAGALPEIVGDGGLLVPRGDSAALAAAIMRLLCDPARRSVLGERGRARVLNEFTPARVAERMSSLYQQAQVGA